MSDVFFILSTGVFDLPWWGYVLVGLGLTHITIAAVTIFLHRHQAHRALELHPVVSHFFRFWLWLTSGMVTKEWVAIHRKHHAKCETEDDPHSPQVKGIDTVMWRGSELYRAESLNTDTLKNFGHATPDDWLERHVYSGQRNKGIVLMLLINLALFGPIGLTIWAVQMIWIPFWAAGVINGIGHYWGYRNYEVTDASTNIVPFGILIGGEELHNNHHAFPASARLSSRRWEFDLGWFYIRTMQLLKLARVKKLAPRLVQGVSRPAVDMETLKAVINGRVQVMASYASNVLKRVHRDELRRASGVDSDLSLLKRARRWLVREETLMDADAQRKLADVLKQHQALHTVYQYKQRLQAIWQRSTHSQEQLLQALQEWCRQAEATGIRALQEFARTLRGYSLEVSPVLR